MSKPYYYLVKQKESCGLAIIFKHWHSFNPLCEVVYFYNDITVPPCERRVACSVINPRKMTATCSTVAIVKHNLCFFMGETLAKDAIYTSMIQSVLEYEIVFGLMAYTMTFITRSRGRELQSLEID
jgi:hypothetical protein